MRHKNSAFKRIGDIIGRSHKKIKVDSVCLSINGCELSTIYGTGILIVVSKKQQNYERL